MLELELALKLAANGFILVLALIGSGLEYHWQIQRSETRRSWVYTLLGFILVGAVVNAIVIVQSHGEQRDLQERIARIDEGVVELVNLAREQDPNLTEHEALKKIVSEVRTLRGRTSNLERELEGVKRYGSVAKLNGYGLSGRIGPGSGLKETSVISQALEGAYLREEVGGQVRRRARCDDKGIAAFRRAVKINPDFPFSHWALAMCAVGAGGKEWRTHAERAVTILEHTTQIAGHHRDHDEALQALRRLLTPH